MPDDEPIVIPDNDYHKCERLSEEIAAGRIWRLRGGGVAYDWPASDQPKVQTVCPFCGAQLVVKDEVQA